MRFWQEQLKGLNRKQASAMRATCGSFARDQRAAVLPIMAAFMMVAAGGAALAVDVGRAYAVKSDLQSAADSAALAAAVMLPDVEAAMHAAQRAVDRSLPDLKPRLTPEDLEFGDWNAATHSLDKWQAARAPFA